MELLLAVFSERFGVVFLPLALALVVFTASSDFVLLSHRHHLAP